MKTASKIRPALSWSALVKNNRPNRIAVSVKDGIITVSGKAASLAEKLAIESTLTPIEGVREVINRIEVESGNREQNDTDIEINAMIAIDKALMPVKNPGSAPQQPARELQYWEIFVRD